MRILVYEDRNCTRPPPLTRTSYVYIIMCIHALADAYMMASNNDSQRSDGLYETDSKNVYIVVIYVYEYNVENRTIIVRTSGFHCYTCIDTSIHIVKLEQTLLL